MGRPARKFYDFAGERLTIKEIAERTGLEIGTLTTRLHCGGLSLEAPLNGSHRRYTLNGESLTVYQWAARWNTTAKNARQRIDYYLRQGRTTDRHKRLPEALYCIDGKTHTRHEWAAIWQVGPKTASGRIGYYLGTGRAQRAGTTATRPPSDAATGADHAAPARHPTTKRRTDAHSATYPT